MSDETQEKTSELVDLVEVRKASGISLEEISRRTQIPVYKLTSIEKQDFRSLGEIPFALGYVRSYCKIIKLDPELLIEEVKKQNSALYSIDDDGKAVLADPVIRKKPLLNKISVTQASLVVIVLWGIVVFFTKDDAQNEGAVQQIGEPEPIIESLLEGKPENGTSILGEEPPVETKPRSSNLDQDAPSQKPALNSDQSQSTSVDRGAEADREVSETATEDIDTELNPDSAVESNIEEASDSSETSVSVANASDSSESTEPSKANDLLVMSFSDDCWVKVTDARGRDLIAELKRKGDNLQLFGQSPFDVVLGNARAVTLSINERLVSTEPSGNKKTLRLSVDG